MELEQALETARRLMRVLRPHTERIQIAGSIRRREPLVKDIELVLAPRVREVRDLFGNILHVHDALEAFPWRRLGDLRRNGPRYKRLRLRNGIEVDLFVVRPPAQFGYLFALRTGPASFSRALVTPRRKGGLMPDDLEARDGAYRRNGVVVPTPTEAAVFRLLGLEWVPPWERHRLAAMER